MSVYQEIMDNKIIAILRGFNKEQSIKIADALLAGGIKMMEMTFDQQEPDSFNQTADTISNLRKKMKDLMFIGAGTVTSAELVDIAANAGAQYIISPNTDPTVIQRARKYGLVSIPGAMTPSEILYAHSCGADFVKIFPAASLGTEYIKAVRSPISHVKLLAVGGVNEKNAREFMQAGYVGLGIGGNLVNKKWVAEGEMFRITSLAKEIIESVR